MRFWVFVICVSLTPLSWAPITSMDRMSSEERKERAEARAEAKKRQKIFNACILDKSSKVDMNIPSVESAVIATCRQISEEPSWFERWLYE